MTSPGGIRPAAVVLPWASAGFHERSTAESRPGERSTELPRGMAAEGAPTPTPLARDRVEVDEATLLSAAVLLDVLATATRRLEARATVLADVAHIAVDLGAQGADDDDERLEALVALAAGDVGARRGELAMTLAAALGGDEAGEAAAPTPAGVATALCRIAAATQLAVREARAVLEARVTPELRQA